MKIILIYKLQYNLLSKSVIVINGQGLPARVSQRTYTIAILVIANLSCQIPPVVYIFCSVHLVLTYLATPEEKRMHMDSND